LQANFNLEISLRNSNLLLIKNALALTFGILLQVR